jgi:hypothetical protein
VYYSKLGYEKVSSLIVSQAGYFVVFKRDERPLGGVVYNSTGRNSNTKERISEDRTCCDAQHDSCEGVIFYSLKFEFKLQVISGARKKTFFQKFNLMYMPSQTSREFNHVRYFTCNLLVNYRLGTDPL